MWATISQSMRRKIVVLVIAVVGFLFMYEAEMFDSRSAFWQSLAQSGPPRPGSQLPFAQQTPKKTRIRPLAPGPRLIERLDGERRALPRVEARRSPCSGWR